MKVNEQEGKVEVWLGTVGRFTIDKRFLVQGYRLLQIVKGRYSERRFEWRNQYCPEPYTHAFMSAGENCEYVLEAYRKYKRTPTKTDKQGESISRSDLYGHISIDKQTEV